ncbi:MAG: hypothetical protein IPN76_16740 [Saprospiraceae bacterium]|nr:hypothetical protein [Saprospiraceae bacterium]
MAKPCYFVPFSAVGRWNKPGRNIGSNAIKAGGKLPKIQSLMKEGFVPIPREVFDSPYYLEAKQREMTHFEAQIDLYYMARWQPGERVINGQLFSLEVGQIVASLRFLLTRWNWKSTKKVSTFLNNLQKEGRISHETETGITIITIWKRWGYESQNNEGETVGKQSGNTKETAGKQSGNSRETVGKQIQESKKEIESKNEKNQQAAGEIFEKLSKRVGPITAKICIEGNVGQIVGDAKRPQLLRWLEHKFTKGQPVTTTQVLFAIVQQFQENDLETLANSVTESIGGDYSRLVISKQGKQKRPNLTTFPEQLETWH